MNLLDLRPEQHAALYDAARHRAAELRRQAIAEAIDAVVAWLRRVPAVPPSTRESIACHS